MIKVVEILEISLDSIICRLSNNDLKRVWLMPMIAKHNHLNGIEKLKDPDYIQLAQIGDLGEIFWPNTIVSASGDVWNYDIFPEYIYHCGEDMDIINKKII